MKKTAPNHYERAFENWLVDNRIRYVAVDEHKKKAFAKSRLKSFDFLIYPPDQPIIITELKGRIFKGVSLAKLSGLECWVTSEDIEGLEAWQKVFGEKYQSSFVFAYRIANIDVDFNGRDFYELGKNRYVFFAVKLGDYLKYMKLRSPKWKTVTLPADKFRSCAVQIQNLLI